VLSYAAGTSHDPYEVQLKTSLGRDQRDQLRDEVLSALANGWHHVIVDCAGLTHIDVGVVSTLIQCARMCFEHNAYFALSNVGDEVSDSLRALRLEHRVGMVS
jgi:anti-anti-sigma regulatory factor